MLVDFRVIPRYIWAALFSPKKGIPSRLSSSHEELPVSDVISPVHTCRFRFKAQEKLGRVVRTNAFEVM